MLSRRYNSIAYRMTAAVLTFSLLLAITSTLGLYVISSHEEADKVEQDLRQLAKTNVPGINESLWIMDMPSLQVQLNSLLNIPHVTKTQVEANGRILASAGNDRAGETAIRKSFPLSYNLDGRIIPQGNLLLQVDSGDIARDLLAKAHVRFLFQLGQIVLVAVFMLFIFRQIVTRRLAAFESYISELNHCSTNALVLPKPMFFKGNDELDMLVQTFNSMSDQLRELIAGMKQRESDLHRLTIFQRAILDNAAYGIIATDSDGIIRSFNRAAEHLLGYTAEEVIGKQTPANWHDQEEITRRARHLSEEFGETVPAGFETFAFSSGRNLPEENEWNFIRKDGTRVPVLLSVTALRDENGCITGFVGLTYDITERKRAEEMLHLQTVELEEEVAERQMTQESLQEKALLLEEEIEKRQKTQEELELLNEQLEQRVKERTAELEEKNTELYRMNRIFVGRELRMVELKARIKELENHIQEIGARS